MLPDSLSNPPEAVCHQHARSDEVYGRPEAAGGQVALVLYGAVAAAWRHILRHGGRLCSWFNGVTKACRRCGVVSEAPSFDDQGSGLAR